MPALAITDIGNMYGAFKFVREAYNHEIKPIVGCELFVAEERLKLKSQRITLIKDSHKFCLPRIRTATIIWRS